MNSNDQTILGGSDDWQQLPPGTMLENYRIERLLGRGGMGAVYLAEHMRLGKRFAVKVLPAELSGDPRFRKRFEEECRNIASLDHAGVVTIYYAGESNGLNYLAMEYLEGGDLEHALKDAGSRMSEDQVQSILRQLLETLAYAHDRGVIHRDLKPANILLTSRWDSTNPGESEPVVKIADFGLAQVLGEDYMKSLMQRTVAASALGDAGTIQESRDSGTPSYAGTVHFMAPEVVHGGHATARSDLYAVGVIGYYLLTGRKPIGRYKDASTLVSGLDPGWDSFLNKLMEPDPSERTENADAALESLRAIGPGSEDQPTSVAALQSTATAQLKEKHRPPSKSRKWLAMAAATVIALGAVAWWLGEVGSVETKVGERTAPPVARDAPESTEVPEVVTQDEELPVVERGTKPSAVRLQLDPPEAGARIWLGPHSDLVVGADGTVVVEDLPLGEHELVVNAPGYQPLVTRIMVPKGGLEQSIPLVPIRGTLEILTSPGAEVSAIDAQGRETRLGTADQTGRLTSDNVLRIGDYTVRLRARNRETAEEAVTLGIGRTVRLERVLAPDPGELRVLSVPDGARVELVSGSWRETGTTPFVVRSVPTEREVEMAVSLRGYRTERRTVRLEAAQTQTLNLGTLVAEAGSLELRITNEELRNPDRLSVEIDGRAVSTSGSVRTGLRVEGLEVGTRKVDLSHPSYESHASEVTIQDQRTTRHELRLTPKPGLLTVEVRGPPAGSWSLEVNGEEQRPVGGSTYRLPAEQSLNLSVSARSWQPAAEQLTLPAGGERRWSVTLEETRGPVVGQNAEVELPGGVKLELIWIRPGEFVMGSPSNEEGRFNDEGPQTRVRLTQGYWLGKYPVTVGEFRAFAESSGYRTEAERNPSSGMRIIEGGSWRDGPNRSWRNVFAEDERNPVVGVSWNDAMEFCRWLTERERAAGRLPEGYAYTLPSEAQWEYASRSGTTTRWWFGENESELGNYGWFSGNSGSRTHPVGQKRANPWGLYDVHGNVWEWTRSWWQGITIPAAW